MRQITLTGRLGNDPKIEQTKNGNKYISFRIASQEYGENEPSWVSVRSFNDSLINKMGKYLKKGSSVIVSGDYSDKLFQNKEGNWVIIRDLNANSMYFNSNGEKQQQGTQQVQQMQPQAQQVSGPSNTQIPNLANEFGYNPKPQQPVQTSMPFGGGADADLPF